VTRPLRRGRRAPGDPTSADLRQASRRARSAQPAFAVERFGSPAVFLPARTACPAPQFGRSITMKMTLPLAGAVVLGAAIGCASPAPPAFAQGAPQQIMLMRVDPMNVASGFRVSKIRGSTVVNENDESIGKIDDIIISSDGKNPFVVLSVGGFLGIGDHLVALPYDSLKIADDKIVLAGASKDQLKALPQFKYATK
jgi:sporulation protein YlmC with PRC-barrel domain